MTKSGGDPSCDALEKWIERFGAHTASYVLLEGNERYVCLTGVEGFVAYELRAGFPIVAGDPVYDPDDAAKLLRAVKRATRPRPVFAYAVRPEMLPAFRAAGFEAVPIGVEPTFDPRRFSLRAERAPPFARLSITPPRAVSRFRSTTRTRRTPPARIDN